MKWQKWVWIFLVVLVFNQSLSAQTLKMEKLKKQIELQTKNKTEMDQQHSMLQSRMEEIQSEMSQSQNQISESKRAFFNYLKLNQEMMQSSLSVKVLLNSTPAQIDRKLKWIQILQRAEKDKIEELIQAKNSLKKLSSEIQLRETQLIAGKQKAEEQTKKLTEQIRLQAKILEKTGFNKNVLSKRGKLSWPVRGKITHTFGSNFNSTENLNLQFRGIQIESADKQVFSAAQGTVLFADPISGLGNVIIVDHGNEVMTAYAHLGNLKVSRGKVIQQGESLGEAIFSVGETTVKVYFEIRHYGLPVNPKDWLDMASLGPMSEKIRTTE